LLADPTDASLDDAWLLRVPSSDAAPEAVFLKLKGVDGVYSVQLAKE
jgi:hypothetical protein